MNPRSFVALSCFVATAAFANPPKAPEVPKELEAMKQLAGTWEGTTKKGDGAEQKATAVYEVTSGGSAVTSKLFNGQPHEMISIYHREGKGVGMTHYCAAGNQPHMVLTKSDGKVMNFEVKSNNGLDSANEMHMHAVTLTLVDANTLKEEWTSFENGKNTGTVTFNFKRAAAK